MFEGKGKSQNFRIQNAHDLNGCYMMFLNMSVLAYKDKEKNV